MKILFILDSNTREDPMCELSDVPVPCIGARIHINKNFRTFRVTQVEINYVENYAKVFAS